MRLYYARSVVGLMALLVAATAATAGPFTWTTDSFSDHTGTSEYKLHGIGYRIENGQLDVIIRGNYPNAVLTGPDSYNSNASISPGDLYINVGGHHNSNTGSVFGLAFTNHSGDMTADPNDNGLPWPSVSTGNLYGGATFATGTNESYPYAGVGGTPYDGGDDPYGHDNNLPVLIAGYTQNLGYQSPVTWNSISGEAWDYEISTSMSLADLNLYDTSFELWWSME
ncbi:MAG: hypothetical protein HUU35_01960, partial [Armatimonadetes bacterium]|nr:hypothetical protein [Armatimonadota bacterium]